MSKVIDLRDEGGSHELLTSQSIDGLIGGGKLLSDRPLASYLEGNEEPRYILRNKSAGLTIDGPDGERTLKPADDYQIVALVSDVRVLFVAGDSTGDKTAQIPLSGIVEARSVESRLRKNKLQIETLDDETWVFPCSGETEAVAAFVDDSCQIWANAERLIDDVEDQVMAAQKALEDGNYDGAHQHLSGAQEKLQKAVRRSKEAGPGAADIIGQRAHETADWLSDLLRELYANEGATAHSRAQRDWDRKSYETAAGAYENAIDSYGRALDTDGDVPADGVLRQRLQGAIREREILRVGPIIDADTARRRASEITDPEKAASVWEEALDGYRGMLGLDWGRDERTFIVNRERIREQTTEISDDAILDYHEAGKQWLSSGDKLAVQGQEKQAREVYERAQSQFEQALQLAREVKPEHVDDIESALETVEERLAGDVPDEIPEEEPLAAAEISGLEPTDEEMTQEGKPAGSETGEGQPVAEHETTQTDGSETASESAGTVDAEAGPEGGPAARANGAPESTAGTDEPAAQPAEDPLASQGSETTEDDPSQIPEGVSASSDTTETPQRGTDESSVGEGDTESSEHVPSEQTPDVSGGQTTGSATERPSEAVDKTTPEPTASTTESEPNASPGEDVEPPTTAESEPADTGEPERHSGSEADSIIGQIQSQKESPEEPDPDSDATDEPAPLDSYDDDENVVEMIRHLDEDQFQQLVADLWEAQGWSTTVFSAGAESVYDVVAMRTEPVDERLLVWIVHRPDGGAVETQVVKRCATARESSRGADSAILVTTGVPTTAAARRADELDVDIVDTHEFVRLLRFEGLLNQLSEMQ